MVPKMFPNEERHVTTTDAIRDVRLDLNGLDERSERLRQELRERTDATREQLASRAADLGGELASRATEMGGELASRATDVGEELGERANAARSALAERYHELEEELPIEEVARKARITAWRAAQAGLSGLMTLPGLLVRGLGALSSIADDVAERGVDVSERGRELVAAVPPSKAERRHNRTRMVGIAALGFLAGLVTGTVMARRSQATVSYESVSYEPPLPRTWEPTADPVDDRPDTVDLTVEVTEVGEGPSPTDPDRPV